MTRLVPRLGATAVGVLALAGPLALAVRPVPGAPVLAWFGADALPRAVAAGALPVAPGPAGSLLLRGEGDLAGRLSAAGAWLVLRADALAGCLPTLRSEGRP